MCGRYTRHYTWAQVREFLAIVFELAPEMPPSYNVAPTHVVPVCRLNADGQRELAPVKWGFVPSWAKDAKIGSSLINARAETAAEKPAFRSAFKSRRCVVPVSGFYEWKKLDGKTKQPMYITRADGAIMLLAGLWERWIGEQGEPPVETMTILTTAPNTFMAGIHDRMPVLLEPEAVQAWLGPGVDGGGHAQLLGPAPDGVLIAQAVSTRVNSVRNNDPSLCDPLFGRALFE